MRKFMILTAISQPRDWCKYSFFSLSSTTRVDSSLCYPEFNCV